MIGGGGPTVQGKKTREKGENWEVSGSRTPTIRPPVQSIRVLLSICVDAHLLLMIVLLQLASAIPTSERFQLYHFLILWVSQFRFNCRRIILQTHNLKVLSVRLHLLTIINLIKQVLSVRISLSAGT